MKTWTRAIYRQFCGRCGAVIAAGEPALELRLQAYTAVGASAQTRPVIKLRCEACEGPAPAIFERVALREPAAAPPALTLTRVGALLRADWKQRAAGREPGEEG